MKLCRCPLEHENHSQPERSILTVKMRRTRRIKERRFLTAADAAQEEEEEEEEEEEGDLCVVAEAKWIRHLLELHRRNFRIMQVVV